MRKWGAGVGTAAAIADDVDVGAAGAAVSMDVLVAWLANIAMSTRHKRVPDWLTT
jgi:hypothetical protein